LVLEADSLEESQGVEGVYEDEEDPGVLVVDGDVSNYDMKKRQRGGPVGARTIRSLLPSGRGCSRRKWSLNEYGQGFRKDSHGREETCVIRTVRESR